MITIRMSQENGKFAENKDIAKRLREEVLLPALKEEKSVTFDFQDVSGVTQSFIHALVSDAIRQYGEIAFDNIFFKNANPDIQEIITIVYNYMQEALN